MIIASTVFTIWRLTVYIICAVLDNISSLSWHPSSHFFASAGGTDRHIRVWHNTAGMKAQIRDLETQLKKAKTESVKVNYEVRFNGSCCTIIKETWNEFRASIRDWRLGIK